MKNQFSREELLNAISQIDKNPKLKSGRHSSTYNLLHKNKTYPPILVLSLANKSKNGKELKLSDFGNNVDIPFNILRENGFEIEPKQMQLRVNLKEFIKVADEQITGQGTLSTATKFVRENRGTIEGLNIEISFGVGRASAIPWIAFTGFNQSVKNGIYPVYLYYKDFNIVILAYGVSESNKPLTEWNNSKMKITIKKHFEEKLSKNPNKYGSSYIYKIYEVNSMPSEKILEKDLNNIIEDYKFQFSKRINKVKSEAILANIDFSNSNFQYDLTQSGLLFSEISTTRFTASLLTKPFVILTGLSGSGKTKLAQAFVQWICQNDNQYRIVPVGADWTNREPLLGYPNALNPNEYVKPDNGVLDLILQAHGNEDLPHFLILDEMNLSHVERYFADFLSVMESKDSIPLYSEDLEIDGLPSILTLPSNLFIIGTVNIDETTNMFSPKVLDRANTIEFRVTEKEMESFLNEIKDINMASLTGKGAGMAKNFLEMAEDKTFATENIDDINKTLIRFFGELKKTGAEFGYRGASEILRLIHQLSIIDNSLTTNEKLDISIMQKLLPKLHGSRRKLCPVLSVLGSFCIEGEIKIEKDVFEKENFDFEASNILYPLALEKITRMYRGAIDNGFASFAEA